MEGYFRVGHYSDEEWEEIKTYMKTSHSRFYRRITGLRVFDSRAAGKHKTGWFYRLSEWWFTP